MHLTKTDRKKKVSKEEEDEERTTYMCESFNASWLEASENKSDKE